MTEYFATGFVQSLIVTIGGLTISMQIYDFVNT